MSLTHSQVVEHNTRCAQHWLQAACLHDRAPALVCHTVFFAACIIAEVGTVHMISEPCKVCITSAALRSVPLAACSRVRDVSQHRREPPC